MGNSSSKGREKESTCRTKIRHIQSLSKLRKICQMFLLSIKDFPVFFKPNLPWLRNFIRLIINKLIVKSDENLSKILRVPFSNQILMWKIHRLYGWANQVRSNDSTKSIHWGRHNFYMLNRKLVHFCFLPLPVISLENQNIKRGLTI